MTRIGNWGLKMSADQNTPVAGDTNQPGDLQLILYREIGIPALLAALVATAPKRQKLSQKRKEIPAVLCYDEAA